MSKYHRLETLNTIEEVGLVPLFYHKDPDVACKIIDACLEGGARCIEFTNRGDGAHIVFEKIISHFEDHPKLILGSGSIMDAGTASLFIQLGSNFIVSPILNEEVAYTCNLRKLPYFPGCGTVNEISRAEKLGVEICKYFPGGIGGPSFIKNISGPMPWTSIMPTGGVSLDEKNITDWITAGAVALGIGSNLIVKEAVREGDYLSITKNVQTAINWIQTARETLLKQ